MMSGDAVFVIVSVILIFAFTGYMIWVMNRRTRLLRQLAQLLEDRENAKAGKESPPPDE
jgi:hypothetical protein